MIEFSYEQGWNLLFVGVDGSLLEEGLKDSCPTFRELEGMWMLRMV